MQLTFLTFSRASSESPDASPPPPPSNSCRSASSAATKEEEPNKNWRKNMVKDSFFSSAILSLALFPTLLSSALSCASFFCLSLRSITVREFFLLLFVHLKKRQSLPLHRPSWTPSFGQFFHTNHEKTAHWGHGKCSVMCAVECGGGADETSGGKTSENCSEKVHYRWTTQFHRRTPLKQWGPLSCHNGNFGHFFTPKYHTLTQNTTHYVSMGCQSTILQYFCTIYSLFCHEKKLFIKQRARFLLPHNLQRRLATQRWTINPAG